MNAYITMIVTSIFTLALVSCGGSSGNYENKKKVGGQEQPAPDQTSNTSDSTDQAQNTAEDNSGATQADTAEQGAGEGSDSQLELATYDGQMADLIERKCLSCHAGTFSPNLSDYDKASSKAAAMNNAVQSGRMPQGGTLSADEKALFQAWADAGAPQS